MHLWKVVAAKLMPSRLRSAKTIIHAPAVESCAVFTTSWSRSPKENLCAARLVAARFPPRPRVESAARRSSRSRAARTCYKEREIRREREREMRRHERGEGYCSVRTRQNPICSTLTSTVERDDFQDTFPTRAGRSAATGACERCLCEFRVLTLIGFGLASVEETHHDAAQVWPLWLREPLDVREEEEAVHQC